MKKSSTPKHMLVELFGLEFVEIVQDFEVTTSFQIVEDRSQEIRMPMTVQGLVMDADEHFLYLSADGTEVNQALPITSIKHISIVPVRNPLSEILDEAETPEGNNFN